MDGRSCEESAAKYPAAALGGRSGVKKRNRGTGSVEWICGDVVTHSFLSLSLSLSLFLSFVSGLVYLVCVVVRASERERENENEYENENENEKGRDAKLQWHQILPSPVHALTALGRLPFPPCRGFASATAFTRRSPATVPMLRMDAARRTLSLGRSPT